jgi:hypothetical protein
MNKKGLNYLVAHVSVSGRTVIGTYIADEDCSVHIYSDLSGIHSYVSKTVTQLL